MTSRNKFAIPQNWLPALWLLWLQRWLPIGARETPKKEKWWVEEVQRRKCNQRKQKEKEVEKGRWLGTRAEGWTPVRSVLGEGQESRPPLWGGWAGYASFVWVWISKFNPSLIHRNSDAYSDKKKNKQKTNKNIFLVFLSSAILFL